MTLPEMPEPERCPEVWMPPELVEQMRVAEEARDQAALDLAASLIDRCELVEGHRGDHEATGPDGPFSWPAARDELLGDTPAGAAS